MGLIKEEKIYNHINYVWNELKDALVRGRPALSELVPTSSTEDSYRDDTRAKRCQTTSG